MEEGLLPAKIQIEAVFIADAEMNFHLDKYLYLDVLLLKQGKPLIQPRLLAFEPVRMLDQVSASCQIHMQIELGPFQIPLAPGSISSTSSIHWYECLV